MTTTTAKNSKKTWQKQKKVRIQNITLSADADQIASARTQARYAGHSLNSVFREWLADYTRKKKEARVAAFDKFMKDMEGKVVVGRKFTREEMNER